MECVTRYAERAIDFVLELTIRHAWYIIDYRENVEEFNATIEELESKRERVMHEVDEAENDLQTIEKDVNTWLGKVENTIKESKEFQNDAGHRKSRFSDAFIFSYLRNRHRLGRKAKKMAADVKLLIEKSHLFDGVSHKDPTSNDADLFNAGYVELFGSRKRTVEEIMDKLEDSTVRMIGVHGPGGVGKSTLVREIGKRAKEMSLFSVVIFVEITINPNPKAIQEEIANRLGLNLEGEGETRRANRLRMRLKREKENTLLILDDIWDRLDLNKLGIPFDNDSDDDLSQNTIKDGQDHNRKSATKEKSRGDSYNDGDDDLSQKTIKDEQDLNPKMVKKEKSLGDYKGCKILLTSRDRKVLSDKMDVKSIFCVRELDDKDALMLFKKVVGKPDAKSTVIQGIVKEYCAGIPMAIVTVGRALRNISDSESVWEATLGKLKKEELMGVQQSMEISVQMSYDHLESEELKSIFLLCAQMGHRPLIMDLVKYCYGLGIFEGVYTLREVRDRINRSIQKLKDSGLILDGSSSDGFNMHDMVRDAALSIARKEQNVLTMKNGKLDDWPEKDKLERCTAISVRNSDIIDELPKVINCPQLKFFQIDSDDPSLEIPDSFFEGMEKLRVLILNGLHLAHLPSSIKRLSNLRMLCLERCLLDGDLSAIGHLKKLRILSFSRSQIQNFPVDLGCLDKLRFFDMSYCSIMKEIPSNFVSSMTCLEELYIRKSLVKIRVEGETNQSQNSFLSELKHLHQLKIVDLCIPSAAVLPRDLFFDELNDYKIAIGDFNMLSVGDFKMPHQYEALRSLALQLDEGIDIHSHKGIKLLFKRVENLLLGELNDVRNVFYELNLDGFPDLKHLSIINNSGIEYIINSVDLSHPLHVFPNLESLCLYKLRSMKMICCSPVTDASFTKLKTIKVKRCSHLRNLFFFCMVKLLVCLETMDVSECDSLKEIVVKETQVISDKVEFRKLRSLTLQSLPSFTSFYTPQSTEVQTTNMDHIEITIAEDEHRVMAPLSLFSELVEIPNLESLKLSSIDIHKIWSDQPASNFHFQNLIKLTLEDCCNLRYLCSLSVATSLMKLKGLFISGCRIMEKIIITEENNVDKVCIFPKLEEIRLTKMNMLTDIWQTEVDANSFSSLISVHIEGCEKLEKIFPSHMAGRFGSLDSLKVLDCKSVEVIFEINETDASRIDTKLQLIVLSELPKLKQVWSKDPLGILNFSNLRGIEVSRCKILRNVLPASVAKDLKKLEYILVGICKKMEEIVASEDGSETMNEPLVFPEVTFIQLYNLSNLQRFCMGRHTIECPKLKELAVDSCENVETFTTETTNNDVIPIFTPEKVMSNLEYFNIGMKEVNWLKRNIGKYRMQSLKELTLRSFQTDDEPLYWFLHRMPNLERLNFTHTSGVPEEFVPSGNMASPERLGTVLQLKELTLVSTVIKDLGLERDPVLQRLEHLGLFQCDCLTKLAPSSVSMTHLTYLEVRGCHGLINLMTITTAKSLIQLKTLKVIQCAKVKEIVTNEGDEKVEIVFSKLITVELLLLECLTSFCSYKNCEFKFPSLERLFVTECTKMETFTGNHAIAPKLQNILASEGGEEETKWPWEGDLNATIQKVFKDKVSFQYTKHLKLSFNAELIEQLWHCNDFVHESCFGNLKSLALAQCDNLVHAIPSHLLPCFENLEDLEVSGCSEVEVIFNINEMRVRKPWRIIRLKKLSLSYLPKLEHVWNKDPEGIISLQVLQDVRVEGCDSLISLFPSSVPKDLRRLEVLSVSYCKELLGIFSKDEIIDAEGAMKEFVFHYLTQLVLKELPKLKYFYSGLYTLEWPVLEILEVFKCDLVALNGQEHNPDERILFQIEKVIKIPSLKKLRFSIGHTEVTWYTESAELLFHELQHFPQELYGVLYGLLDMLPVIEKLLFGRCYFQVIFSPERPNADESYIRVPISHLKELVLIDLDNLNSIGLEHSWLHPFPQNLQILRVQYCRLLINLVPCMVSFSSLTYLEVWKCKCMIHLFTSSTAKSLVQLKRMEINRCRSMQEIVSNQGDESREDEKIVFEKLQVLYLENLDTLRCFYPGNFSLYFPSLEQVFIINCRWMKTFCRVNKINPTKFSSGVKFSEDAKPQWEGDLNSTLLNKFEEKISESASQVSFLMLENNPLQEIWHGSLPVPNMCFNKLVTLVVEGCEFLTNVLPSNLLPFFTNLKKLEVRRCTSVKIIFDVKFIIEDRKVPTTGQEAMHPLPFSLETLILEELPNLKNVWNEDPLQILSIQHLQDVHVYKCDCLTSLFPASVAKDIVQLKSLFVQSCEGLRVIAAEDNADPKGTSLELMFPSVTSLTLLNLPNFKYFNRSLPCDDMLKITHQEPDTQPEDQVNLEKLTPNLQYLQLGQKELKMIWHEEYQGNILHKLKVLVLLYFHSEPVVFPYGFLQQVPNIEKLVVSRSSFKEIFSFQKPDNVDYSGFLWQLKTINLEFLSELISIGLEHSWVEPSIRNIETLEVIKCFPLRSLAPSLVSFSNLVNLVVIECQGLVNLFTSSTAKTLVQLKIMSITGCQSTQEIVSKEADESLEHEIIFWQLQSLYLEDLPNLISFYSGRSTLSFPSLEQLSLINCHMVETFCPSSLNAEKLVGVKFQKNSNAVPLEVDLNSTIRKQRLSPAPII